jgi:8-oxo-dGTP diphosphatase
VPDEIRAAGGVVVQDGRVAVVHRPRYDDWSLPKGKLDPGESWEQAALREIEEETGLRCRLEQELAPAHYLSRGLPKTVRWWRMTVVEDCGLERDEEVDELRWLTPDEAVALLSYEHYRRLVRDLGDACGRHDPLCGQPHASDPRRRRAGGRDAAGRAGALSVRPLARAPRRPARRRGGRARQAPVHPLRRGPGAALASADDRHLGDL